MYWYLDGPGCDNWSGWKFCTRLCVLDLGCNFVSSLVEPHVSYLGEYGYMCECVGGGLPRSKLPESSSDCSVNLRVAKRGLFYTESLCSCALDG